MATKLSINESIYDILLDERFLIYQDILLWHAESYFLNQDNDNKLKRYKIKIFHGNSSNRFVITDLGYWLLYYHQPFRDKYSGSHIRKSNHIQDQREYLR